MKLLELMTRFINVKEVVTFFIAFLRKQVKKTDNSLDDITVDKIEKMLIDAGFLNRL